MSEMLDISVVILTRDEEIHIRRCLENVRQFSRDVYVVDSFSADRTCEIAREMGATVLQHQWENNYAKQFNWALDNCGITTQWTLRLDADEYLFPETIAELREILPTLPDEVTSLSMDRARFWMGRQIRRGTGKVILKRFFRTGIGRCEVRLMDEHIVTSRGKDYLLNGGFADDNLQNISWWAHKHVNYAIREAIDLLDIEYGILGNAADDDRKDLGSQAIGKRRTKHKYAKMPLFWRALAYFLYRYILKLGFLEGKEGFCWHFFQGLWYRMFVDAKVFEIKKACGNDPHKMREYIESNYHIALK